MGACGKGLLRWSVTACVEIPDAQGEVPHAAVSYRTPAHGVTPFCMRFLPNAQACACMGHGCSGPGGEDDGLLSVDRACRQGRVSTGSFRHAHFCAARFRCGIPNVKSAEKDHARTGSMDKGGAVDRPSAFFPQTEYSTRRKGHLDNAVHLKGGNVFGQVLSEEEKARQLEADRHAAWNEIRNSLPALGMVMGLSMLANSGNGRGTAQLAGQGAADALEALGTWRMMEQVRRRQQGADRRDEAEREERNAQRRWENSMAERRLALDAARSGLKERDGIFEEAAAGPGQGMDPHGGKRSSYGRSPASRRRIDRMKRSMASARGGADGTMGDGAEAIGGPAAIPENRRMEYARAAEPAHAAPMRKTAIRRKEGLPAAGAMSQGAGTGPETAQAVTGSGTGMEGALPPGVTLTESPAGGYRSMLELLQRRGFRF